MHVTLIVPAPFATVSGGYAYDRRVVAGLREAGHTVDVTELAGTYPLADETARAAARTACDSIAQYRANHRGLALPAFVGLDDALTVRDAVGLIHHPTALETGFNETDRTALLRVEKRLLSRLARIIVTSESLPNGWSWISASIAIASGLWCPARTMRRAAGAPADRRAVSLDRRTGPRKGHDLLLRALTRLFDLDWQLTIVGSAERDPVHAGTLARWPSSSALRNGGLRRRGDGAALAELWRGVELFALATHWEGYGMVVAEALKRGVPVAVSAGGAAGSLVTAESGVVCPPAITTICRKRCGG